MRGHGVEAVRLATRALVGMASVNVEVKRPAAGLIAFAAMVFALSRRKAGRPPAEARTLLAAFLASSTAADGDRWSAPMVAAAIAGFCLVALLMAVAYVHLWSA